MKINRNSNEEKILNKFASTKQNKEVEFWLKFNSDDSTHTCLICNQVFCVYTYSGVTSYAEFIEDHKQNHLNKLKVFD